MKRIDAVIALINSLTKSEKKHISQQLIKENNNSDFGIIYKIIINNRQLNSDNIKSIFHKTRPNSSFEVSIKYLYDKLLDTLLLLRKNKDNYHDLLNNLCKARMLYDKSLFEECFEILSKTIQLAQHYEQNEILMIAIKLELEYLLRLNFPNMTEKELYHKHFIQNETLKKIRKVVEQSSLHNLLKFRLTQIGAVRTKKQKKDMSDLMVNELYIASSSPMDGNFELTKNHKLFQGNYLMGIGDYKTALNSFKELNLLFEQNPQFLTNPPIYYVSVLEGVLNSLRSVRKYNEMPYFLNKLKELSIHTSLEFKINTICLIFQYELFPFLDKGEFSKCMDIMDKYQDALYSKDSWLNPIRKSELLLYTALVYIGNQDYKLARKYISNTIIDHNIKYSPLMKTIRLVRLIAYYEMKEYDFVFHESQSITRNLRFTKEKAFKTEQIILWYLNKKDLPIFQEERDLFWGKLKPRINNISQDKYESQILRIFDFTAWVESKILRISLSKVLRNRIED